MGVMKKLLDRLCFARSSKRKATVLEKMVAHFIPSELLLSTPNGCRGFKALRTVATTVHFVLLERSSRRLQSQSIGELFARASQRDITVPIGQFKTCAISS